MAQQLPSPNPKYPFVGPTYMSKGEVPGYIYNPWTDKYRPDPKMQAEYAKAQGLGPEEPPGLLEQLGPVAAGAAALEAGKWAGGGIPGIFSGGLDKLGGLFGVGGGAAPSTAAAAVSPTGYATTAMPTVGPTLANAAGLPAQTGLLGSLAPFALPAAAGIYGIKNAFDAFGAGEGKSGKESILGNLKKPQNYASGLLGMLGIQGAGLLGSLFGSGKDQDQMARDAVRSELQGKGLIDENYALDLGAGQKFDIGRDGSEDLYNVDLSSISSQENLKTIAPLALVITGGDKKLGSDFAGYFTNAIQSAQDPFAAAKQMYSNFGVTNREQARAELNKLAEAGKLTREEVQVYDQGLANVFPDKD